MRVVEFPSRGITAQFVERWPLVAALGATDAVVPVDLDDLTAHAAGDLAQFTLLVGRGRTGQGRSRRCSIQKMTGSQETRTSQLGVASSTLVTDVAVKG